MGTVKPQLQKLEGLLQTAQSVCEQLEKGQAATPLMDRYTAQLAELENAPLTAVLLGMTPESLEQTLKWLYGDVFTESAVATREWPQFMEINITDGTPGFGLRREKQRHFEEQEAFLDALRIEFGATRASINNPLALSLQNVKGVAGIKLLVPHSPEAVLESPDVLNAIIAQSNFVMVAAPLNYTLSREDHEAVETLTTNMCGFWPLLTVDELSEEVNLPEIGWWEQHTRSPLMMPPKLVTRHVEAAIPEFLTQADHPDRQGLIGSLHAKRLSNSLNAIFARYQQQAGVLEQQVAKAGQQSRVNPRSDAREGDQLRQQIDDWLVGTRKDLVALLQEINLPNSRLAQTAQGKIASLEFGDLEAETGHSMHKLTLGAPFVAGLRDTLLRQSKTELATAVERSNKHLASLSKQINEQLKAMGVTGLEQSEQLDVLTLQQELERRLELDISYRGEMPKRTFMTRLGESRRLIMGLSMTAMVLGGVAKAVLNIDLRASLMTIAPVILIGGFIYTYFQWPKEDAEKLGKELDRIRDTLNSEVRRLINDIQRFAQQQITEAIDGTGRQVQKQVQQVITSHRDQQRQQEETKRASEQQRAQQLEQELRHWQGVKRQLERLKADAAELDRELNAALTS